MRWSGPTQLVRRLADAAIGRSTHRPRLGPGPPSRPNGRRPCRVGSGRWITRRHGARHAGDIVSDAHRLRLGVLRTPSGTHPRSHRSVWWSGGGNRCHHAAAGEGIGGDSQQSRRSRRRVGKRSSTSLGINVVRRGEPTYPAHLDRFEDAPDLLFVRGDLPTRAGGRHRRHPSVHRLRTRTRRCLRRAVAEAGWPVVSGLARGIDGAAHRGMVRPVAVVSPCSAAGST